MSSSAQQEEAPASVSVPERRGSAADCSNSTDNTSKPADDRPTITCWQDLHTHYEAFHLIDGQNVYNHCTWVVRTSDYVAFMGQSTKPKLEIGLEETQQLLRRIPDHEIYPKPPRSVTSFTDNIDTGVYFKSTDLVAYEDHKGTDFLARLCRAEVDIHELLRHNPHPNIVTYNGCITRRGRIVGFVLDRYPIRLLDRVEDPKQEHFNIESFMEAIESGVKHLHSLGLAHNDLNPMNIMVDDSDNPIIIDFGSCLPFGSKLLTGGTAGWVDNMLRNSAKCHDESGLSKIKAWMEKQMNLKQATPPINAAKDEVSDLSEAEADAGNKSKSEDVGDSKC